MKYNISNVIGRFQLPHKAHIEMILKAHELSTLTLVCIGSANLRRSLRNPFTFYERAMLIENSSPVIKKAVQDGFIKFVPIEDSVYSDQWWVEHVQRQVNLHSHIGMRDLREKHKLAYPEKDFSTCLVGHKKDDSSYYLDMFPQWTYEPFESKNIISATQVRELYFQEGLDGKTVSTNLNIFTTAGVKDALKYIPTQVYETLKKRYEFVQEYKKQWGEGPHYTADAVVIKSGHVLLIQRGQEPDIGAWAFPGGFSNENESFFDAAIRECNEETGLDPKLLMSSDTRIEGHYKKQYRDDRGDIRTQAILFNLGNGELPKVKGQDDAAHAEWVPIADLRADNMFADHYFIFRDLIRKI